MEAWEKVYVGGPGGEVFLGGVHGQIGCIDCHGGWEGENKKDAAHGGRIDDPSVNFMEVCGTCHSDVVEHYGTSLHNTFHGYETLFEQRSGLDLEDHDMLEGEFRAECGECHTTCGSCHISRPKNVEGGLVQGHRFLPVPNQTNQCTACHGSRVGEEYLGTRDGYAADVHYVPGGMNCMDCHTGAEMHGDGTLYETRYQVADMPRCEDCHSGVSEANNYHETHWDEIQCQVCHSQDYKNCNRCHVGGTGIREESYLTFKMGRNPIPEQREYEYVAMRHIPIAEDTYLPWGIGTLADFAAVPTWKYSSPHNIQRWTSRTEVAEGEGCGSACHGTPDVDGFFLREADLEGMSPAERAANEPYIVPNGSPFNWD